MVSQNLNFRPGDVGVAPAVDGRGAGAAADEDAGRAQG